MVPPVSWSSSAILWAVLCCIGVLQTIASPASPSPPSSHRVNAAVVASDQVAPARQGGKAPGHATRVPSFSDDLERPPPALPARSRPHSQAIPGSLPDSIRDFRFNAPIQSTIPSSISDTDKPSTAAAAAAPPATAPPPIFGQPSVDDLTLSSTVLVVTVDGQVHALNRETSQWLWTLHDDGGAALGGASPRERNRRSQVGSVVGSPLVRAVGRRKAAANASTSASGPSGGEPGLISQSDDHTDEEPEDELYVIEPFSGGDIYLYTRGESTAGGGSLEKLPLSMQQLVALSPFTFPSDASRVFVGRKETNLVGVDLRTGRLVGVFGSRAGWCDWDASMSGKVRPDEECEEEISRRPEDLLYMARTEYHLSIYAKTSSALLQTLSYTTYSSSSLGNGLQEQWTRTPDDRYLQPTHDGNLYCFHHGIDGIQWAVQFEHPVVSVFDIALPPATIGQDEVAQPIMLEQPLYPVEELASRPESAFIGRIGDDFFAMSRNHFPFVAIAPASPSSSDTYARPPSSADSDKCQGNDCILGRHKVALSSTTAHEDTIDPPADRLGIDAPPSASSTPKPSPSLPHAPSRSSILSQLYQPVHRLSPAQSTALVTSLLVLLGYLSLRKFWGPKAEGALEGRVKAFGSELLNLGATNPLGKNLDASLPPTPLHDPTTSGAPLPPTPVEEHLSTTPHSQSAAAIPSSPDLELPASPPQLPPSLLASPAISPVIRNRSASISSPPLESKELPPIPPSALFEGDEGDSDGEGDGDGEAREGGGTPRQGKKPSRRRRGKKKKGPKALEEAAAATAATMAAAATAAASGDVVGILAEPEAMESDLNSITLAEVETREDPGEVVVGKVDPNVIGGLTVSETILGYGSHGTVVIRGEFQGRAVAVKRLLKDFVTIATHEVALLQESDDHPHVIRYFCKEQRDTFLYIALELCPASLFDLIDQPSVHPDLVRDLDSKRALKQITSGVRHLHKLKIVHRDIKPQNILVSTSKHGGVRMLISDFGLCKKLDVDESSFEQTVNHAAGSFGYRAPEVLRGHVDPNAGAAGSPVATVDSAGATVMSTVGSGGSIIATDTSMRLTRSIDIFSLGCIFYYVLTGGEHPFGGRFEREMNILNGKVSLERLDGLGEEALEAQDIITRMVATDPRERPSAESVLLHPFFWNAQKRLLFLCDASDRFEIMERDPPAPALVSLESGAFSIVGDDWQKAIDRILLDNLGKYRKYDGRSVRDLLRVLRNKKHHYQDLPEPVRKNLGDLPGGFLTYFTSRFPRLLLHVYATVAEHVSEEAMFASTFSLPEDEST